MLSHRSSPLLIPILMLGTFGILTTEMGIIGILPIIAEHFKISIPDAGWMITIFALIVAISAPVMPLFFLNKDRKSVMIFVLIIFMISTFIGAYTTNYTLELVTRAIPAFFHSVYITIAFTVAAQSVNSAESPKAVGKIFLSVSAGLVMGVPLTNFIGHQWGFTNAMLFFSSLNFCVLLATLIYLPSLPASQKQNRQHPSFITLLTRKNVWLAMLATIFTNGALFGFYSYFTDYLSTIGHISFNFIALFFFFYGIANMVGNGIAGGLLVQRPFTTLFITSIFLTILYATLYEIGQWSLLNPFLMMILVLILGITVGIVSNGNQYMVSQSIPELPEFANGLFLTGANLGTAIGTFVCGLLITYQGTEMLSLGAFSLALLGSITIGLRNKITKYH